MSLNSPSLSVAGLAFFSAAIHFVLKGVFFPVSLFLSLARFAVMAKIGCNSM